MRYEISGFEALLEEVQRITRVQSFRLVRSLEDVLRLQFLDTFERAHAVSGSLRASGKSGSTWKKTTKEWTGEITYGGPLVQAPVPMANPGPRTTPITPSQLTPKDPVDYAIYEAARGGPHDFFGGLVALEPMYEQAILRFFRDEE